MNGKKEETDRRRGGNTIFKNGLGQLKTGQDGKGLFRSHLWCPNDLARLWDRLDSQNVPLF